MIKLALNTHKTNNYAFFCPVSRLHLTVSSPVGFANEVTPAILRALRVKTILDVDGVIDIEAGAVKVDTQAPKKEEPVITPEQPVAPVKEENQEEAAKVKETPVEEPKVEAPAEEPKAEEKPKKGGKKAGKAADAE
jgi:hypothetical protein